MALDMPESNGRSLRARIYNHLKDDILAGKYKTGDNLVEMKLAKELGVSRTPIREALRQLELEGLVISIPNKGVIVQGISKQDLEDIYTIRYLIEGLAARWAIVRITDSELKEMEQTLDLIEFYTIKGDAEKWCELDTEFHEIIFRASKSKPLWNILSNFHHFTISSRLASLKVPGRMKKALEEHRAVLEAFKERDAAKAEKALKEHVLGAKKNIEKLIEKHLI
ncbi:MAG: hypothetical protein PWQ82_850 [Thermosediminibacterales bacterium]|nr:hypothetical protein [Thermosediminibacterales bacterium]MDK2835937.1 hypothetical protein [Thermosediminibacterales bacterium]